MRVDGRPFRTLWPVGRDAVEVIDQSQLPHRFEIATLTTAADAERAIRDMVVRGAPLIGATAAFGLALAAREDPSDAGLDAAARRLAATRPTAVNLAWALSRVGSRLRGLAPASRPEAAWSEAVLIAEEDAACCEAIGEHGLEAFSRLAPRDRPLQILTHCNAGWLAALDWGTALAPVYKAHRAGLDVHVWVDETRPRNQGAALTLWELRNEGVPCTLVTDNAGGHLLQRGRVDLCVVGADRVAANGDVCNKIGTYLKALAAADAGVPFFAALPFSTIDWSVEDGVRGIPIEERAETEVTHVAGLCDDGHVRSVRIAPEGARAANFGFDVTPARLVTGGLLTEKGLCAASRAGLAGLYPLEAARGGAPGG